MSKRDHEKEREREREKTEDWPWEPPTISGRERRNSEGKRDAVTWELKKK